MCSVRLARKWASSENVSVEITPVATGKERRVFLQLPWKIYPGRYPAWVPPLISEEKKRLDPKRNPFFEHGDVELLLAYRGGEVVGRIAAVQNRLHNEFHKDTIGFFGQFESRDDQEVANALFDAAADWVGDRGLTALRGPVNFSTNEECGLLVDCFDDSPYVLMPYNPAYYEKLFEGWGLTKEKDLLAFSVRHDAIVKKHIRRLERFLERAKGRLGVRAIDMKRFDDEVNLVRDLYNASWERNWGFVPMTDTEVDHMAKGLKPVVKPDLALIGEIDGEPVGFALALPDINQALQRINGRLFPFGLFRFLWGMRRIDRMRVLTLGVKKEYRRTGLDALLYLSLFKHGRQLGIDVAESSWILEDNQMMIRPLEKMGFAPSKTYRIYERRLGSQMTDGADPRR